MSRVVLYISLLPMFLANWVFQGQSQVSDHKRPCPMQCTAWTGCISSGLDRSMVNGRRSFPCSLGGLGPTNPTSAGSSRQQKTRAPVISRLCKQKSHEPWNFFNSSVV